MSGRGSNINSVFYAAAYHPIQAGSIDGTDIFPHDNAVYRAVLCSSLYDPSGDPKLLGDPYRTVFVSRLSHLTTDETLRKAMSKYGHVRNLRLVRDIVTGASSRYAFVEYETEREMHRAYKDAHHSYIDDSEIVVDYSRQQLMPGWIPRRLGGGLGGKKESGQLRFGGRERPFRAPLKPIPYDDLKRLGISPPPEGRYMSRYQVPSPPRRKQSSIKKRERHHRGRSVDKEEWCTENSSLDIEDGYNRSSMDRDELPGKIRYEGREERHQGKGDSRDRSEHSYRRISLDREEWHHKRSYSDRDEQHDKRSPRESTKWHSREIDESSRRRSCRDGEGSRKRHRHDSSSDNY